MTPSPQRRRRGSSFIEVQAAFVSFGVLLVGLGSLTITQLRLVERIEGYYGEYQVASEDSDGNWSVSGSHPAVSHYFNLNDNPWVQQSGGPADYGTMEPTNAILDAAAYEVTRQQVSGSYLNTDGSSWTVRVHVEPIGGGG